MKKRITKDGLVTHSIQGNPAIRLSDPSMKAKIGTMKARLQRDPTFARGLLREAGIVTPSGKLSKKSGG
jgi:hypothetical protein